MIDWIIKPTVLAIHDEQLAEHGGLAGVRDENGIEAALARPLQLLSYGEEPDLFALAAVYATSFAQRQYFNDGNKRVSAVVTELFLALNGFSLNVSDREFVATWLAVATRELSEAELAAWLRSHSEPL